MSSCEHCWHFGFCCSCGSPAGFEDELITILRDEKIALNQAFDRIHAEYNAWYNLQKVSYQSDMDKADEDFQYIVVPVREQRDRELRSLRGLPGRLREEAERKIRDQANAVLVPAEEQRKARRAGIRDRYGPAQLQKFRDWAEQAEPLKRRYADVEKALRELLGIEFPQVHMNAEE